MLESKQVSEYDEPSNAFLGVRFVLAGFDSVREDKVSFYLIFLVSFKKKMELLILIWSLFFRCGRSFLKEEELML